MIAVEKSRLGMIPTCPSSLGEAGEGGEGGVINETAEGRRGGKSTLTGREGSLTTRRRAVLQGAYEGVAHVRTSMTDLLSHDAGSTSQPPVIRSELHGCNPM
jgi:hypothetical protein